uniref:CUE domain-containing protein n=1 Tax=Chromera velia CCMP2878 TaxID=1169474 RepID=A0A0G4F829_9ALVE|eukprot:Cvel_15649.t1-p1 / transcript=Cvel_15649.t1 / gene=Cvel_15649 / organism=Chromera_velia_CCMP2878 / gene_product=hypothetical protein / transcript_product=hypothetical protein / location=Cvel_scaffold1167:47158-50380(+) / protein_length=443 / sequence_SO=supercontig / SO=protein_coding / is_pseudo=false
MSNPFPVRPDAFAVLGVAPGVPLAEISRTRKTLARQYHPDKHPNVNKEERKQLDAKAIGQDPVDVFIFLCEEGGGLLLWFDVSDSKSLRGFPLVPLRFAFCSDPKRLLTDLGEKAPSVWAKQRRLLFEGVEKKSVSALLDYLKCNSLKLCTEYKRVRGAQEKMKTLRESVRESDTSGISFLYPLPAPGSKTSDRQPCNGKKHVHVLLYAEDRSADKIQEELQAQKEEEREAQEKKEREQKEAQEKKEREQKEAQEKKEKEEREAQEKKDKGNRKAQEKKEKKRREAQERKEKKKREAQEKEEKKKREAQEKKEKEERDVQAVSQLHEIFPAMSPHRIAEALASAGGNTTAASDALLHESSQQQAPVPFSHGESTEYCPGGFKLPAEGESQSGPRAGKQRWQKARGRNWQAKKASSRRPTEAHAEHHEVPGLPPQPRSSKRRTR